MNQQVLYLLGIGLIYTPDQEQLRDKSQDASEQE